MGDWEELAEILIRCWHYDCDERCPWYCHDEMGFHCERYKNYDSADMLIRAGGKAMSKTFEANYKDNP